MRQTRGFTLIELMFTVAIMAILAAIALPSYSDYVRRGRLTETLSALAGMRVKMEQFFQDNRTYNNACTGNSVAPAPPDTITFTYACTISGPTTIPSTYTITSTGVGTMAGFAYTLDQTGARKTTSLPSGWQGVNKDCWVTKRDGSC